MERTPLSPAPVVSAVIPVRNGERWLEQSLWSVLHQSLVELELIVIDDGSTDGTPSILQQFAAADARVEMLRQESGGAIVAFNVGAQLARGRYLAWLGADDVAVHGRFEKQVQFLDRHPDVAVLGGSMLAVDECGRVIRRLTYPADANLRTSTLSNPIAAPTAMMRRTAFESVGGCRVPFIAAEDYDLWLRMAERYTLRNLPDVLTYYRVHAKQVTFRDLEQQLISIPAAEFAAALRRSGRSDPFDGDEPLTTERLLHVGADRDWLQNRKAELCASRAAVLVWLGQPKQALDLLDRGSLAVDGTRLRPRARAMLTLSRARAMWAAGDHRRAVMVGLGACREDPAHVARALSRKIRRLA